MSKKEFLQLLDKYLAGNASVGEEELLLRIYESYQDRQEWDSDELEAINSLEDKLFEKIKATMDPAEEPVVLPQIKHWPVHKILIAASVILLAGLGLVFLLKSPQPLIVSRKPPVPVLKNDFKPGGNNAYLILANGEKVVLNQARVGLLAQQGQNAVIKQNDGQIVYNKIGSGALSTDPATSDKAIVAVNKVIVPVGGQYRVMLPDGTNVWLNAASSLEYPVEFAGDKRRVKLTGEAYFEVTKNKEMPFVVNVNGKMNVNVLGTNFNIMAYEDEGRISTTLLTGSVKVEDLSNPANERLLIPGQQADLSDNAKFKVVEADTEEAIAWKEGQFLFINEDIHSIMRKLSRWYDIDVVYSEGMKNKSFDGSISRNRNISEVLKLMELTKSIHFTFEKRRILVMP